MKKAGMVNVFKYMFLILMLVVVIIPIIYVVATSLTPTEDIGKSLLWPKRITLDHYKRVLFETMFLRYMLNTVFLAVTITLGNMLFNAMAAYSFARIKFPGKNLIFMIVLATLIVPGEVLIIPQYMLIVNFNWIDDYKALIIPGLAGAFGIFFMRQFLLDLPKEMEEASFIDGCSRFRLFRSIIIPLVKAPLLTTGIMTFFGVWDSFLWPLTVINSKEKHVLQVAVSLLETDISNNLLGPKFTNVVLSSLPVIVLFIAMQKYYIAGITAGAVKG